MSYREGFLKAEMERRGLLQLLRPAEAARRLGVTVARLAEWRFADRGPAYYKIPSGRNAPVRYTEQDLLEFLEAQKNMPPKPQRPK